MSERAAVHVPVMVEEVMAALAPRIGGIYVDCTFGRGGHTRELLSRVGATGRVLALDRDPQAVAVGQAIAMTDTRLTMERSAFSELSRVTKAAGVFGQVDGVLLDLGVSSPQLADPRRGFGFSTNGPLDMRMDPDQGESASAWLRRASERQITAVLWEYGEERFARRIARAIVKARAETPLDTTGRLAEVVAKAVPAWPRDRHPATRTFQAVRIFINAELDELKAALVQAPEVLAGRGRLVVISFHSLEDRIVKRFFRDASRSQLSAAPRNRCSPQPPCLTRLGKLVRPSVREVASNPRARSARLRAVEKCA
nr:16S rRNA (cytosine(1402)-N(4))-methyltransferase RsmH [Gammaproteobacteria bacterium]